MAALLRIHPRYMRSVHLERDLADPRSSEGYVLTPVAKDALLRIADGFSRNSTQRAFRISGDYGSGKSAFGLALARIAGGFSRNLPKELHPFSKRPHLLPCLATGDHEPLGVTVLRALGLKQSPHNRPSTAEVLSKVNSAIARARARGFSGALLVLDELGKNLEFAAQRPECDDIFLLQRLAEEAARSGNHPLVVVVMLHQGVAAYASGLDSTARREWDKVAGRFEEILFAQPLEQLATLVATTLNVDSKHIPRSHSDQAKVAMATALRAGIYGSSTAGSLAQLAPKLFPIHPTAFPVLVKAIRKFGQNERSLFSFLSAAEPMGLQEHVHKTTSLEFYRVHHLFDYVRQNLLPSIGAGNSFVHWGVVDSVISSTPINTPEEEAVLKCTALLNLLDSADLPATEEFILLSLDNGNNKGAIGRAIQNLRNRTVLYDRGSSRGLYLWPHTSVNLDEAFERGRTATRSERDGIETLCKNLPQQQIVPRGHYFRTGTLRYAEVHYAPASMVNQLLTQQPQLTGKGADLNLRVLLPANSAEYRHAQATLRENYRKLGKGLFVAVAAPPTTSAAALWDLIAWKWVQSHTPPLANDRYAREEVARQVLRAERCFRDRLRGLDALELPIGESLVWFHTQGETPLEPGRQLLKFLGEQCDAIYTKAPRVLNELINRRCPSSAAVAARTKLVEAMATAPEKPLLGLDDSKRPPEVALYMSVLKQGGLHVQGGEGWLFQLPNPKRDVCKFLPVVHRITAVLHAHGTDAQVGVPEIFDSLSEPPFGVREGLQPFLIAMYLATHHQRVALYEDGTYVPTVGGDVFLRLMKEPQFFHLQYCELKGVRADVFTKLLSLLQISPRDAGQTDLMDLVRPLALFISQEVPEYCRKTSRLSAKAIAVRRALMESREPVKLVFTTLPGACGLPPISEWGLKTAEDLATRLRSALHEIRTGYPNLIARLGKAICAAFDIDTSLAHGRSILATRAGQLAVAVTEPTLKAFALRLADLAINDRAWIESIANLLARKSPERWTDNDETEFHHQLETASARFKRTELALIGTTKELNGHACRIALTKSDGTEIGDLINWAGMDENRIRPLEGQIKELLCLHGRHGLAAAMRAIWSELDTDKKDA